MRTTVQCRHNQGPFGAYGRKPLPTHEPVLSGVKASQDPAPSLPAYLPVDKASGTQSHKMGYPRSPATLPSLVLPRECPLFLPMEFMFSLLS